MIMTTKYLFVINPVSGTKGKSHIPDIVARYFAPEEYEIIYTKYAGHATKIAQEAVSSNLYAVVAVGGDGTVSEVASGLVGSTTALGIIPMGSGNGLARHLKISLSVDTAIKNITTLKKSNIDVCYVNDHLFLCTSGIGFEADVAHEFANMSSRGLNNYIKAVWKCIQAYKPIEVSFDSTTKTCFTLSIANAGQYGNDAHIAPLADIQDGKMDVCIIRPFPIWYTPIIIIRLFSKNIYKSRYYQSFKTDKISIRSTADKVHHDGEPLLNSGNQYDYNIKPARLPVLF